MLTSLRRAAVLAGTASLTVTLPLGGNAASASAQRPAPPAASATTAHLAGTRHKADHDSLLGFWNGTVKTTIPTGGSVVYRFNTDGTMEVIVGAKGFAGQWTQNSDGTFSFEVTLPETDSSGNLAGFSYAVQHGQFTSAKAFTSSGITTIYDLHGNVTKSFGVDVTATRAHHP